MARTRSFEPPLLRRLEPPAANMQLGTNEFDLFLQLTIAAVLGIIIGAERTLAGKPAGMRTYALVTLGSCLFIVISTVVTAQFVGLTQFDPLRVAAGVVMGIGFIGTGLTVLHREGLAGLTTAAGIWVAAAIGIAVGFKLYALATFATLLTLLIFTLLWFFERSFKKYFGKDSTNSDAE